MASPSGKVNVVPNRAKSEIMLDMKEEMVHPVFWRDAAVEFFLSFTFATMVTSVGSTLNDQSVPTVQVALGIGFTLLILISIGAHMGGCHVNPTVTTALMVARKISIGKGIVFLVAQILGGMAGAGFSYGMTPEIYRDRLGPLNLATNVTAAQGFAAEWFTANTFAIVVQAATDGVHKSVMMPQIAIGICICANILTMGKFTGAGFNPMLVFGPAVITGKWDNHWVYWVGPLTGAVTGAILYEYIFSFVEDKFGKIPAAEDEMDLQPQNTNVELRHADYSTGTEAHDNKAFSQQI